jgi:hypothetical protein
MDRYEVYFPIMLLTILTSEMESKLAMVRSIPTYKGSPVKKENKVTSIGPILTVTVKKTGSCCMVSECFVCGLVSHLVAGENLLLTIENHQLNCLQS